VVGLLILLVTLVRYLAKALGLMNVGFHPPGNDEIGMLIVQLMLLIGTGDRIMTIAGLMIFAALFQNKSATSATRLLSLHASAPGNRGITAQTRIGQNHPSDHLMNPLD
jgi:hypothetical protein